MTQEAEKKADIVNKQKSKYATILFSISVVALICIAAMNQKKNTYNEEIYYLDAELRKNIEIYKRCWMFKYRPEFFYAEVLKSYLFNNRHDIDFKKDKELFFLKVLENKRSSELSLYITFSS